MVRVEKVDDFSFLFRMIVGLRALRRETGGNEDPSKENQEHELGVPKRVRQWSDGLASRRNVGVIVKCAVQSFEWRVARSNSQDNQCTLGLSLRLQQKNT